MPEATGGAVMSPERPVAGRTMRDFPLSGLELDVMQRREKAFPDADAPDPGPELREARERDSGRTDEEEAAEVARVSGRTDEEEEPRQLAWQGLGGALWSDVSTENGSCDEWSPDEDVGWAPAAVGCDAGSGQAAPTAAVVEEAAEPPQPVPKSSPIQILEPARVEIAEPLQGIRDSENHVPGVVAFLKTSDEGSYHAYAAALTLAAEELRVQARVVSVPTQAGAFDVDGEDRALFTTVMLRNLPTNLTQLMLLELLDGEGFARQYDFVYVPVDFKKLCSFGYALVNFLTHEVAESAMESLRSYRNWPVRSSRACSPVWQAPIQGLDAHVQRYRDSPLMHPDVPEKYKPMLFSPDGQSLVFPAPTKKIKAPRRGIPLA